MAKELERREYEDRWARCRTLMDGAYLDVLMATRQSNYRYLCGHQSVQFALEARPLIFLLPLASDPLLLVPASEAPDARAQTWVEDVRDYRGVPFDAVALVATLVDLGLGSA